MANNTWDVECDNWSLHLPFFFIATLSWSIDLEELSQVLAHPLLGGHLGLQWHKGQEDDRSTGEAHLENKTSKISGIGHSSKHDEIDSILNRRFLRRSRTTCWRSWSSRGAPSWSGWSWSSGGCSGATLLGIQAWNTPWGYKYAIGAKSSCNFLLTHIFVILIWWSSHIIIRDAKRSQYAPAWCWETQKIFNLGGVVIVVLQSFCVVVGVVLWSLEICIFCSMWRVGAYLVSQTHLPFTFYLRQGSCYVGLLHDS